MCSSQKLDIYIYIDDVKLCRCKLACGGLDSAISMKVANVSRFGASTPC